MPAPHRLDVAGASFPIVAAGSGPAILFVHGSWADLRIWCGIWQRIARRCRFIAFTQRHFGLSEWPDSKPFSRDVHTRDLLAILESLDEPVHLAGWSYAGAILLQAAAQRPDLVRSLVIYEPSYESEAMPNSGELRRAREMFWQELEPVYANAQAGGDLAAAMRSGIEMVFGLGEGGFATLESRFQTVFLDNAHTMLPELNAPHPQPATSDELRRIECPALIVCGERTHAQYRTMAETTVARLPNVTFRQFDGVGHGGPVEMPVRLADAVLDFVDAVSR